MKFLSTAITVFCIFLLTACGDGGGGGGSSTTPTQPTNASPAVNISGIAEVDAGGIVSLTANATDSDGTIASYAWSVDSGAITLNDASKAQVSFTAPSVDTDTAISLSVSVADNKGATTKATKQIMVKKKVSLTITGLVLNGGAVPNADITFTVGDSTFSTKANAAGEYSITISAGSKNENTPVLVTAVGDATNPKVKLVSQLYSVSKLTEQAGSDKVLNAKENLSVNISNVTTAEYAILKAPTSLGFITPIATDEQLQNAQKSIGSTSKIYLARYLQIIATDSRFKLPDASKNTLDFLQNQDAINTLAKQLHAADPTLLSNTEMLIASDKNLINTNKIIAAQYLLDSDTNSNSFRLTLNKDFTGILEATTLPTTFTATLKWIQDGSKITLNFLTPVETGETRWNGRVVITSAELSFSNHFSTRSNADFSLSESVIDTDGNLSSGFTQRTYVTVYDTSKFLPVTAEKVAGEWMSNYGYYQFNADKTALNKPYDLKSKTIASNWSIDNNKLALKSNDSTSNFFSEEIYLLEDLGVGYSYVKIYNYTNSRFQISTGWLIKPQSDLQLTKSDFVGNWLGLNNTIELRTSDNQSFTNFSAWPSTWSSVEGSNTQVANIYTGFRPSCDLNVGTHPDCELFKNYTSKVIAVDGDQYYSLRTETTYTDSNKTSANSELIQSTRLPEITHFGEWIFNSLLITFYEKTSNGIKVWNFKNNELIINDKKLNDIGHSSFSGERIKFSFKNYRLQYTRDNIARELLLVSASENGLTVCEYNQGASCAAGTEFLLSNRSPAKVTLKVEGSGTIQITEDSFNEFTEDDPNALFGHALRFKLTPDTGALVQSVTGCGGALSGNSYTTPEVRDACTITATFTQLPVVTLNAGAHGTISKLTDYQYNITPDANYMVDTATGCNGTLIDGQSPLYTLNEAPTADCTITVNFKQKLSVEAKITDPGLASCLDALNLKNITLVTQLDCPNDVVSSLEGIENLSSLKTLIIPLVASSNGIVVPEVNSLEKLTFGSLKDDLNAPTLDVTSIDVSRAKNIYELAIHNTKINSINLNGLTALHTINVTHNPLLEEVDISKTNLIYVYFYQCSLKKIILPASGSLNSVLLSSNQLTELDLSTSPNLKSLYASYNQLKSLDLYAVPQLRQISVDYNQLSSLDLSKQTNLSNLSANNNLIANIDFNKNNELSRLYLSSNKLTQMSLVDLKKLTYLSLDGNQISNIDLSAVNELEFLNITKNKLTTLAVENLVKLRTLSAKENSLATISGLDSINYQADIQLQSNSFDANTLAYLNNLKTVKNYSLLQY